jgi:hypothetical protein
LFVFVVDGAGRGYWTRTRWEGRFVAHWLPAAGVHPLAVAVRHSVRLFLRALPFAWVPLLPIQAALQEWSAGGRLVLLLAGPACALAGDTIGAVSRRSPRWIGTVFVLAGLTYWVSLAPLMVGVGHAPSALLFPAQILLLSPWSVAATLGWFVLTAAANAVANWRLADRARTPSGRVAAAPSPHRLTRREVRPTRQVTAHAAVTLRRLVSWTAEQWVGAAVVALYASMPALALLGRLSTRPDPIAASDVIFPLAFGLALPALVCSEVVWGTLPRDMWALFRRTTPSLYVPLLVPATVSAGILMAWPLAFALAVAVFTPAGVRSSASIVAGGGLLAIHCAAWQALAGTTALRLVANGTLPARATRYAGTAIGVVTPPLMMWAGGPWITAGWVAAVMLACPRGSVAQFSRCEFGRAFPAS